MCLALIKPDFTWVDLSFAFKPLNVIWLAQDDVCASTVGFPSWLWRSSAKKMVDII